MPSYHPLTPQIVDPTGVQASAYPRPQNSLYRLGESLTALADALSQYRWRHFVSVQRLIGHKPGTGGSAGVGWLQHVTEHRFFPELRTIRTMF
jgi:tryptophan 2,3-dioxygenase